MVPPLLSDGTAEGENSDPASARDGETCGRSPGHTRTTEIPSACPVLENFTMPSSIRPACTMCNSPALTICSGCRSGRYCSIECRDQDWPAHGLACDSFRAFLAPPISKVREVSFKRAILFPADSKRPRCIWLETKWDALGLNVDNSHDFLGANRPLRGQIRAQKNFIQGKELDHSVDIIHDDCSAINGSMVNQSIMVVTRYKPAFPWAGNVVALRRQGPGKDPSEIGNMSMEDFRHAVDFFSTFSSRVREERGSGFTLAHTTSKAKTYSKHKVFTLVVDKKTLDIILQ